ncbi:MAG: polysaccharide deacetylase family protein [Anaerolineae bacterium]|jgi:peptidoglycan/xylan/chitin deacetylase (PgdA/CDA1 family)|nr:polysaccharide deacetylase family protein [Anaerolineae bacterium]MBT4456936.1 polysaccharide deacetylase family protein [Anaerolineae bacterium]MBT4843676.1 polysaccharide deacetylase family protein [Anaerolineae bacterium]MBT6060332.1 polysaccharide deacetylase family protein [Anaerolineae bacterium]MBT6323811.1 polysaccharide deacetylase family protein [Anaerolineae bacterium]
MSGEMEDFFLHIPILVYHRIIADDGLGNASGNAVPVSMFERQMRYLHDHDYHSLSLVECLQSSRGAATRHKKIFAITFDDGFEDFSTLALPILRRYGFKATMFLVTDYLEDNNHSDNSTTASPLLDWKQVKRLSEEGVDFGSHTCSHPHLPRLSSELIYHELVESKKCLETELGCEIPFLAYPYGESNSEVCRIAMKAGYDAACGVITGKRGSFNLWRRPCGARDTLPAFAFRLTRWYDYILRFRGWIRDETTVGHYLRQAKHNWLSESNRRSK